MTIDGKAVDRTAKGGGWGKRGATQVSSNPLWSKAPFVLFQYPGLFVSIAVGALLLALAASAYPLFISASASELVKARIQEMPSTRWAVGMMYRKGALPLSGPGVHGRTEARVDPLFDGLVAQSPYLADPLESALAGLVSISAAGAGTRHTRLFIGEGVESTSTSSRDRRGRRAGPRPDRGRARDLPGRSDRRRLA